MHWSRAQPRNPRTHMNLTATTTLNEPLEITEANEPPISPSHNPSADSLKIERIAGPNPPKSYPDRSFHGAESRRGLGNSPWGGEALRRRGKARRNLGAIVTMGLCRSTVPPRYCFPFFCFNSPSQAAENTRAREKWAIIAAIPPYLLLLLCWQVSGAAAFFLPLFPLEWWPNGRPVGTEWDNAGQLIGLRRVDSWAGVPTKQSRWCLRSC